MLQVKTGRRAANRIGLGVYAAMLFCTPAIAQPSIVSFNVEHNFVYRPSGDVVQVRGYWFRHVWARMPPFCEDWEVSPALNQHPDFDGLGVNAWVSGPGSSPGSPIQHIPRQGPAFSAVMGVVDIPPSGLTSNNSSLADCQFIVHAVAGTQFDIPPYSTTPPFEIRGKLVAYGSALAGMSPSGSLTEAYAFSASNVAARGGTDNGAGQIVWNGSFEQDPAHGQAFNQHMRTWDPVVFETTNLVTGDQEYHTLVRTYFDADAPSLIVWKNDELTVDMNNGSIVLLINPALVAPGQGGRAELIANNGVVTMSSGSGVFAGIFPDAGDPSVFTAILPNTVTLDYDLGLPPGVDHEVVAFLGGGADVFPTSIGACPADLNGDGVIDAEDFFLYLVFFAEGDPRADINGDGVVDADDFFAYLVLFAAGC